MNLFDYEGLTPRRIFPNNINDSYIGRTVMYNPEWGNINVQYEYGTIISYNEKYVFIDFTNSGRGQACKYTNVLLAPTSYSPHLCQPPKYLK